MSKQDILIIEPNQNLATPYAHLSCKKYNFTCTNYLQQARNELKKHLPDYIFLSTSFNLDQIVTFLEQLKASTSQKIIPLIFIIDLSVPVSIIPGTTWGGKIGISHSLASEQELFATLERINNN